MVFELIRLGCLWSFIIFSWYSKVITIPLYCFVSLICTLAAVTNFHASIIKRQAEEAKPIEDEITIRIDKIKQSYVKKVEGKIDLLDKKIDVCDKNLAWNQNSHYWKNRLQQLKRQKQNVSIT